ncbi:capsular polysaccharide export protein, LipB/KpsS family [Rhodobacter ferrooxidans]|uniref:Capsule polysaccharide biosynthesis protein n=1 Tax=Rhodobacter ferrooxidans TaxID=371731 RepID=C8RWV1_9RHOB|nr:capsular polysaccharide biosynthesis protein [Rhodobacter sp. SW2]EEW27044.1 Capsule polysaccharide biosynthesis protein [Rhodobacter sp. SW2]
MIVYPAEWNARKEAVFAALALAGGGGRRLPVVFLSFRDFPETTDRVAKALARAKRQPKGALGRWLKRQLLRGQYNWARRYFARHPEHCAAAWNGLTGTRMAFLAGARDAGAAVLHAELAPLPGRITLDPAGVNAESAVPQDAGFYDTWAGDDPTRNGDQWRAMGSGLTARASRRSDVGQGTADLPDTPFLFCPLQVPNDSQVTLFAGWCGGMAGFLAALAQAATHLPEGWHLRLKEHPSARQSLAPQLAPLLATGRVVLDNAADSFAQLAASRGVVTLNSSMGLQAFFHDKPVVALGRAFFALPGLVTPAENQTALNAAFAGADTLTYDAAFRARFMNWLDQVYYPRFTFAQGQRPQADLAAFAEKVAQARSTAARPA